MNRKLWENLVSLFSVQALNYVVPIFTLPFLARVLGPKHWGELAFAEGFAAYISIVVEYGFGLSASREIAQMRDQPDRCSIYFSNVVAAQILLALISYLLASIALLISGHFSSYTRLLPLAAWLALSRSILPSWFFQGLEKMKLIAALNIISNVIAAACLFLFVKRSEDAWLVLTIRAIGGTLAAASAFWLVYRAFAFVVPSRRSIASVLRNGFSLFLFKGLVSLYTAANVVLLGMLATPLVVAWFAGAEKICKAALSTLGPITQTFYPRINYLLKHDPYDAMKTLRYSIFITVGAGTAAGFCLLTAAPWLVHTLLGKGFERAIPILRILSPLPPLISASNVFGIQWMLSLRMERTFTWILVLASFANISCALALVPRMGAMGMAVSVDLAEAIVTGGVVVALILNKRNPLTQSGHEQLAA